MEDIIKEIKKELHANMNGIASAAMRKAGMPYHVIWGIELPRLREIAAEFPHDRHIAQQLWNENTREGQLLGILLTPPKEFLPEVADIWVHEAKTAECISLLAMELIAPQRWASDMAFRWIARTLPTSPKVEESGWLPTLCGWLTICRLLREGNKLMPRSEAELRDHAESVSANAPLPLRKAIQATLEAIPTPENN